MTFIALITLAMLGVFVHWLKRYLRGQSKASFKDYMLFYRKQTTASVATAITAIVTIYATADFTEGLTAQVAALAFLAGYTGDSATNKGPGE